MDFRIDRLITLGIASPALKFFRSHKPNHIPILMYHSISDTSFPAKHPYFQTNTTPEVFINHMTLLAERDYRIFSLSEALNYYMLNRKWPNRSIVLTFDDGYQDFYEIVLPVLSRFDYKATVFVSSSNVGHKSSFLNGRSFMSWDEIKISSDLGMEVGSHSKSHRDLEKLSNSELIDEIGGSKEIIENYLCKSVVSFSCPYAFPEQNKVFTDTYKIILGNAGYKCGVTTRLGTVHKPDSLLILCRIPINQYDDRELFLAKSEGFYNWLYFPQIISKYIKACLL